MWSRVPKDSDPRKTALARASNIYKRQTRPFVREGAPQKQGHNCQTNKCLVWGSTPRLTVGRSVTLTLRTKSVVIQKSVAVERRTSSVTVEVRS
jgi:hypothetical protein